MPSRTFQGTHLIFYQPQYILAPNYEILSQKIAIIHLEDVYITGLCAASCHIRREHHKGFKARRDPEIDAYNLTVNSFFKSLKMIT